MNTLLPLNTDGLFLLDTNFFIQSHYTSYPLDVAESFWNKVKMLAFKNKIMSIDKVREEIYKKEDKIKSWCIKNLPGCFFRDTKKQDIIECYQRLIKWVNSKRSHYTDKAIEEFSEYKNADAWLIAFALRDKNTFTIVTYEKSEPQKKAKIKIPDVCNNFDVKCVDVIGMFRQLGETF